MISYGHSTIKYVDGATSYTNILENKCALVKFDVSTLSTSATCIAGMNNKMTVSFSGNTITPSKEGAGVIKLSAGSGETWAVLLPQTAVFDASANSDDGIYAGTCGVIPPVIANGYMASGIEVAVSESNYVDLGLPSGLLWATFIVGAHAPEEYGDYFAWGET